MGSFPIGDQRGCYKFSRSSLGEGLRRVWVKSWVWMRIWENGGNPVEKGGFGSERKMRF